MSALPDTWLVPVYVLGVGLIVSVIAALIFTQLAMAGGPIDNPRERALAKNPTPTSGGLAVMAATLFGIALTLWLFPAVVQGAWRDGLYLLGFALIFGVCGALDDLFDWPARWRLLFHVALCLAFAALYPVTSLTFGFGLDVELPWFMGWLGSAAWLVLGVNAINFIDGSNGLAPGIQTLSFIAFAGLCLLLGPLSEVAGTLGIFLLISLSAAGAQAGFLPFNIAGKVFQGDAGALFGGALITGLTLVMKQMGVGSVWLGGFMLAPVLVDVVLTLMTRALKRENVFQPHRQHLYQLWLIHKDPSHFRMALKVWGLCALSSIIGVWARVMDQSHGIDIRFPCLVIVIGIYSLGWFVLRRNLPPVD